ncbi:bifunctional hydroxymethylpyrimidine kinase/phosphomethylpyrimidine kinase [Selenomonas montiformis]|uniref:bifunctional hydroxymethylpyrimidine kinase/phosphomethylpyrimidine kinase n=1 Tax=Selenomonas montiformis TaxID=2652285 RepID=UPI003F88E1FA
MERMAKVLTIAGSDSSGGAGIQADLKTMMAHGVYGMSAVTALTAQNTAGVAAVQEVTPEFLAAEIDAVFEDIRPDAVKVGMVASEDLILVIAEKLREYDAKHIVVDPVMTATSGAELMEKGAEAVLREELFPLAELITPNVPELEILSRRKIRCEKDLVEAARKVWQEAGVNVLGKGGHLGGTANDVLVSAAGIRWYMGQRIDNPNTHGTGCTLSSAIASNLAKAYGLEASVELAKDYLTGALLDGLDLGQGSGPLNHGFALDGDFFRQ